MVEPNTSTKEEVTNAPPQGDVIDDTKNEHNQDLDQSNELEPSNDPIENTVTKNDESSQEQHQQDQINGSENEQHPVSEIVLENSKQKDLPPTPITDQSVGPSSPLKPVPKKQIQNSSAAISFIKTSFENITALKEITKKHQDIHTLLSNALTILKSGELPSEDMIFEILKLTCEKGGSEPKILSLDCLSKMFTFNVFNDKDTLVWYKKNKPDLKIDADMDATIEGSSSAPETSSSAKGVRIPLMEAAVQVISSCFDGQGTDEKVELQVIRVLTAAILNESIPIHGKVLLQAVRQIYNIFLLSLSPINQGIAQATLTQVVNIVFDKVKTSRKKLKGSVLNDSLNHTNGELDSINSSSQNLGENNNDINSNHQMTLKDFEATMQQTDDAQLGSDEFGDESEMVIKDAFLIFRSMSNLSVKIIENGSIDMRSHAIRSKLLSLHIIHWVLKNHIDCFSDHECIILNRTTNEKTIFVDAVRKYLCLILSRNSASQLAPVYEISLEIYWILIDKLRNEFKSEIPVFLHEIYFPVSEMKTSSPHQKRYLLTVIHRICNDPRCIIELYLNYDCDPSMPNLSESVMDYLAKFALARIEATPAQKVNYRESLTRKLATYDLSDVPQLNVSKLGGHPPNPDANLNYPIEYALKMTSIDCIVAFLRSLNIWSGTPLLTDSATTSDSRERAMSQISTNAMLSPDVSSSNLSATALAAHSANTNAVDEDGTTAPASQFDTIKMRKTAFIDSVKLFNYSPKKGMKALLAYNFIPSDSATDIAQFLLDTEPLDKATIGEFLGEGDAKNIEIMHAFVDLMEFKGKDFLYALRYFLQHFRLPGESQKIDRFMLKFAEKYVDDNPNTFANADTVYVLSYSVILLNTDQHSPQVKKRMTLDDFIMNNRGIDDGQDLDPALLENIYLDIQNDEIILKSEQQAALISSDLPQLQTTTTTLFGGKDFAKEAYAKASKEMSSKTEQAVKSLRNLQRKNSKVIFYSADTTSNNTEQVRSIFDNIWMSVLAGLTPPFKDYDDEDTAKLLLEGIKLSIHISCMFDLDYARTSFLRALVQFCNIDNPEELKDKNIIAIYALLEVAVDEKNALKDSWKIILSTISQIERLKLLAQGIDSGAVPDLLNARLANRNSIESLRSGTSNGGTSNSSSSNNGNGSAVSGFFASFGKKQSLSEQTFQHHFNQKLPIDLISRINSTDLDVAMDKVFSKTCDIEGNGIFDFIAALSEVAYEEIESSGQSENPRMFSLQKMIDVCYYNMGRIRVQWSALWVVMNEKFNEFGCHKNSAIAFFALDSLRQLSERFFEIEELSHFKFQKEFLKPFNYILLNSGDLKVKEMVLDCVNYMIIKKATKIKSGWVALLEILTNAAKDNNEKFVDKGFKIVKLIIKDYFEQVFKLEGFDSLVVCLTEYAKNEKFQRTSLQALQSMNRIVKLITKKSEVLPIAEGATPKKIEDSDQEFITVKDVAELDLLWFPVLFGFHDVIMTGIDLEVRSEALNFMFDALVVNGGHFEGQFWDKVCNELLFPIFGGLSKHWEIDSNQDDLSVWMSTTLIQALRNMIALFHYYFDTLSKMMDGYLKLLVSCICQENETISKIGISCLKDLILKNLNNFNRSHWDKINESFKDLFDLTTAKELFLADPLNKMNGGSVDNEFTSNYSALSSTDDLEESALAMDKSKDKSAIVIKCVLQLHMIDILSELFDIDEFYEAIPVENLLQLSELLNSSYKFSQRFNHDYDLRVRLWNAGIINKLPNLLKQETSSAAVYISILFRLYTDDVKSTQETKDGITNILIPMGCSILEKYIELDELEQSRNIQTWRPVVVEIVQAYTELELKDFNRCCSVAYELVVMLFDKGLLNDLRLAVKDFLSRVGDVYINAEEK